VAPNPAGGGSCLAVTDAPGLQQTYNPHFYYRPQELQGGLVCAFDIRLAPDTRMYHEWRDWPGGSGYVVGPSLWLDRGALRVAGQTLAQVPSNQWLRVEVRCDTASHAALGWDLGLTLPGQATQWFRGLRTGSTGWRTLNWLGWVSENTNASTFLLDNLRLRSAAPAPFISEFADRTIVEDTSTGPMAFTVTDTETPADALVLTVSSSNPRLVPERNIVLGGSGTNRTLVVAPAPDETGLATIRVTADDGQFHATESFQLTVTPVGGDALRSVHLTSPLNGATNALPVLAAAAADDPDGVLARIEFFADGQPLGTASQAPFALSWTNAALGPHTLVAVACDAAGRCVTSVPVSFMVSVPLARLVPAGAVWKFFDRTNDLGTAWRSNAFNDAGWNSGPAQFGFGDGDEATVIASNRQITTCFRHTFPLPQPGFSNLVLRLLRDDGAIAYLNGVEVFRSNMPTGAVNYLTLAVSNALPADETTNFYATNISAALLRPGDNLLAVEVHQSSATSSDLSFDLELLATPPVGVTWLEVANTGGATDVGYTSARLGGTLLTLNGPPPDVTVFWGPRDGETFAAGWAHRRSLGLRGPGAFALEVTNLLPGATCFYRCFASNGLAQVWAPASAVFVARAPLSAALIPASAVWRYLDDGTDQGIAWRSNTFNDAAWRTGPAQLGFGDGDEATVLTNRGQMTVYFRRELFVPDPAILFSLTGHLLRDDGAVIYLNGVEAWRDNMPAGPVDFNTAASSAVGGADESSWLANALNPTLLRSGWNVVAAEIHQFTNTSSDLSFDFALEATYGVSRPPALTFLGSAGSPTLQWPANAGFFALWTTTNLAPPVVWVPAAETAVYADGFWQAPLALTNGPSRFFRLQTQ
jgi:hypothetical protein